MKTLSLFEYNELNENRFYNKVALYIIIVLIIIFISIIVLLKIKKNVYYSNRLFISDSNIITNIFMSITSRSILFSPILIFPDIRWL